MSAGVGAVSVRLLELCLWVGIVEVAAGMRGSRAGCAGWPARRSWTPGHHPARPAPRSYQRVLLRPDDDSAWHGHLLGRARPTTGAGSVQYPADAPVGGRQRDDVEGPAGVRIGSIIRAATDTGADREADFTARADASFANIATCANEAGRTNHATCAGCAGCATSAGSAKSAGSAMCAQFARSALFACHVEGAKAADQAVTVGSVSTPRVCRRAHAS